MHRRPAGEVRRDSKLVHVALLSARSDHLCSGGERRVSESMFGVKVRRRDVNRVVTVDLCGFAKDGLTVADAQARIHDQRRIAAHNDADIRDSPDIPVGNHIHMLRNLQRRIFFDQRRRRCGGGLLCESDRCCEQQSQAYNFHNSPYFEAAFFRAILITFGFPGSVDAT